MNLCGGITNITEHDLLLELPMDELSFTHRRRKPISGGPGRQAIAAENERATNASPRSNSRGRDQQQSKKSTSVAAGSSPAMLNPVSKDDMAKMRSRKQQQQSQPRMKSSSILMKKMESGFNVTWLDEEGNGQAVNLSSNSDKSSLRIRSRSRDESDNENDGFKSNQSDIRLRIRHIARVGSDRERPVGHEMSHNKASSYFVIKMKQAVGEWAKFKFVAESLAERDAVVLAIRSLIDQSKYQLDERTRQNTSTHERPESRSEHNESSLSHHFRESNSRHGLDKSGKSTRDKRSSMDESTRSSRGMSRKLDDQNRSTPGGRIVLNSKNLSFDEMKGDVMYDELGCNPMNCQSQALAAVEDGELMNFASNQIAGPWCTDDVCTASLTDFADSMKGIFDVGDGSKAGKHFSGRRRQQKAENYISDFLADKTQMSELLSVKDLWTIAEAHQAKGEEIQQTRRIENRARKVDGKALRLKCLQTQMTFNGSVEAKKITFLQTTNSFDDVNRCGKWNRRVHSRFFQVAGQMDSSAYLDRDPDDSEGSTVFCYDSDPEGARERSLKRGPRRAMAERENTVDEGLIAHREALNILGSSRFGLGRKWRRHGDEVMLDIIEATKNEKFTLMWHPTQASESTDLPTVVCVKLWVEAGVYLIDGTFLLPKLTWLPVHESKLYARVLNTSGDTPGSLDLLDVCRVKECDEIDRNIYPFAHIDRSFMIQTQSGKFLFETRSRQERGRVVNGLKLVIARLASLLMLRDLRAVDEFFGGNNNVPGEAPVFARTEKSDMASDFPVGPR